jgi:hypothetical protein
MKWSGFVSMKKSIKWNSILKEPWCRIMKNKATLLIIHELRRQLRRVWKLWCRFEWFKWKWILRWWWFLRRLTKIWRKQTIDCRRGREWVRSQHNQRWNQSSGGWTCCGGRSREGGQCGRNSFQSDGFFNLVSQR